MSSWYFVAAAIFVIFAMAILFTGQFLTAAAFAGGAAVAYFIGMSKKLEEAEERKDDDARR